MLNYNAYVCNSCSCLLIWQAAEAQAAEAHAAEEARIAKARNEEARIAEAKDEAKLAESSTLKENKVRSFLPTSQMLASMNLKEGSNRITFTFCTRVLGKQQVCGIYVITSSHHQ